MRPSWPTKKLGEIAETSSGGTPRTGIKEYWDGDIPWLRSGELVDSEIYRTEKMITKRGFQESSAKMFPKNSVLIALTGATVGKTAILRINSSTNQSVVGIFPNEKNFVPEFIWYFLRLNYPKIKARAYGGAQPHIDQGDVKNLSIPLPPLEIQKQIVERLDKITEAQKLNDDLIQKSDELFQSLLHKELNPAGKDWPTKKLGEVIDINFGERITKTNNSGDKYPVYGGGGESFRTDYFNRENEFVVSRFAIAENCVRFVEGKFWLMDSGGTFSIKTDFEDKLDKSFVGNVLLMRQKEIYNCARGGAQKNIDVDFFKKIKISLPSLETQKQIVAKLSAVQDYKTQLLAQRAKLKELFGSMLHKSMRGELDMLK